MKETREDFKYTNRKMNEKYESIMQKKKTLAIENASKMEKLKRQLESSDRGMRNIQTNAYATEIVAENDTNRQKSGGISSGLRHAQSQENLAQDLKKQKQLSYAVSSASFYPRQQQLDEEERSIVERLQHNSEKEESATLRKK